ncbi:hypothetical protein H6G97_11575 [Nostoc flagelliforme FACHB-838]|uniref:Uncharacterized protein n=1 Tax=Nostoc flagelliforme FACHB-838 TaxID=2692904 RepID=A0ABR8DN45_9NOSO|nr:hypothetical protein [Nostoc flagelliforme]MBD2530172.1 hypothetical protein [Nostoc flagelliforme FACHB-838]
MSEKLAANSQRIPPATICVGWWREEQRIILEKSMTIALNLHHHGQSG